MRVLGRTPVRLRRGTLASRLIGGRCEWTCRAELDRTTYGDFVHAMSSTSCFVCDKHALGDEVEGGIIWSDTLVHAGHCHLLGASDIALGWLIVEPKRHVAGLGDLSEDEAAAVGVLVSRLARALVEVEGVEHVSASCSATVWRRDTSTFTSCLAIPGHHASSGSNA